MLFEQARLSALLLTAFIENARTEETKPVDQPKLLILRVSIRLHEWTCCKSKAVKRTESDQRQQQYQRRAGGAGPGARTAEGLPRSTCCLAVEYRATVCLVVPSRIAPNTSAILYNMGASTAIQKLL